MKLSIDLMKWVYMLFDKILICHFHVHFVYIYNWMVTQRLCDVGLAAGWTGSAELYRVVETAPYQMTLVCDFWVG